MDKPDREIEPNFSQPVRQITIMLFVMIAVGTGAFFAYPRVAPVFLANPYLNITILITFVIGILATVYQLVELVSSVSWIEAFTSNRAIPESQKPSRLLAPLASLMRSRGARVQISSSSARSILDSVATRIEEARDITRYIANLLIFLGLLGTFWGLATTVPAVVATISSLAPKEGEGSVQVFGRLMEGLQGQLGGMGTAFASSLLGLAGSLVLGLLELFANHGQNRFYRELEEWLSTITRLGYAGAEGEGSADAALFNALAEHMAEQMDAMRDIVARGEAGRSGLDERLGYLAASVDRLAQHLYETESPAAALARIAEGQERLIAILQTRQPAEAEGGPHVDAESRMRLRSIDVQLLRILEEMSAGRQESLADLRSDLGALTKAVRGLVREPAPQPPRRG
jgi:hypothetical protein